MAEALTISFEGAARTVTGSRHRIAWGARALLFDCGLFQGHRQEADRVNRSFRFEPNAVDTVVLSHAHLDHSGNLPTLVHRGYAGRIHATPATAELCAPMLADSAFLMGRDLDHVRQRRHERGANGDADAPAPPLEPLYTPEDVATTVQRFETHPYHATWSPLPGVTGCYYDAGHILGSALTALEFRDGANVFRLGMSGDLGRPNRPILQDPESPPGVDALVLESTYGNRLHPDGAVSDHMLADIVRRTAARGGRVLVPAFAVGRAQEIVATLHTLTLEGAVPELPIYVDSPLAGKATEVFKHHPELFDDAARASFERDGEPIGFARLRYTHSPGESRALNEVTEPCIIVSASGMCEGGRILHHLLHGLSDPRNTVMLVGFQAEGTLGRRLQDGAEIVSIFGEPVRRRAEVAALSGYSAHADQSELLAWVGALSPRPRRIFLVHGELEAAGVLAEKLHEQYGIEVVVPAAGERYRLWN